MSVNGVGQRDAHVRPSNTCLPQRDHVKFNSSTGTHEVVKGKQSKAMQRKAGVKRKA